MAQFYEKYWNEGTQGHLGDFLLKWPLLSRHIPREAGVTVIDFGCGKGEIIKEIKKLNKDSICIGLDVSKTALSEARKTAHAVEFIEIRDGESFPVADNTADFVLSSEVIEHVYDTENAVKEISRVMKPGARLLITTPYHGFLKNLAIVFFGFDRHFDPVGAHVRFFSKSSLSALLGRHGIFPVKYEYYGRIYPFSHSIVVLAEKR